MRPRAIVHIDADAFFASVEQAGDPKLRGKPIAVGGEKRGIIASASYEARKFGVYTPMPTVRARKLCPKLIVLPGDFERYEQFSHWMFSYCYDFTPDVEQTSIDEGYFDVSGTRKRPLEIAEIIRKAIAQRLKISVSEGIGSNKLVSAIASKLGKPAAFTEVPTGAEISFLHPLPNKWLPGIGPKTSIRLNAAGLMQIKQVALTPLSMLELLLGGQAATIRDYANGIDNRLLIPLREPQKTFSHQETFSQDLTHEEYIVAVLQRMADDLFAKVREENRSIRTLTVKVRYNDMAEDVASESLFEPTDLETDVYKTLHALLKRAWKRRVSLRLVSLKLSNLYDGRFRGSLPLGNGANREARTRLALVVDELRRTHGTKAILRGHDFLLRLPGSAYEESLIRQNVPTVKRKPRAFREIVASVPLRAHSHYSFLDSTLSPQEIVSLAKASGFESVALTDTGNLHGAYEFALAAKEAGIQPIFGAELRCGNHPLLLYVQNKEGYRNLCDILSDHSGGKRGDDDDMSVVGKERSKISLGLLRDRTSGLIAVSSDYSVADYFPGRFYAGGPSAKDHEKSVACPPIHYAKPSDRLRYDIVQSIRTLTLLRAAHEDKRLGGDFHFRTREALAEGCRENLGLLRNTQEIAERCDFSFPFGEPQFPPFIQGSEADRREALANLVYEGFHRRYEGRRIVSDTGAEVPREKVRDQIETELRIIADVGYEDLFLITCDLLKSCRAHGIEWITRGSAADSLVCYCLGISDVCPIRFGLYFRRFLNKERMALKKLPDIDIDFPHDRKDDVVNLLFAKYGPRHCAVVGGFSTFQVRSAVAEVAKVLGAADNQIRRFTEHFPWSFGGSARGDEELQGAALFDFLRKSPECRDLPLDDEPFKTAVETAAFLAGRPRHPKMHPCGVVLSRDPVHSLTPTFISNKGWPTTHLDMDAVEAVGLVKMDVLAQGGLAVMRDARESLAARGVETNLKALEPWDDESVWEMIATGGARAVHHIESPAMTTLCKMCNVREIDGLVAIVSVIRPGAANEDKKRTFTRRYQKMEPPVYPHPSLEECLRSTFGLVVYEEHILQICEAFAGISPGRADVLRRALVKQNWKMVEEIGREFVESSLVQGHGPAKIKEVWELVTGFNGYAFCRAHSTAYGVEAYEAAWLKRYHPAEFMAVSLSLEIEGAPHGFSKR